MKTPQSIEEQMRSWTPRRPSPRVEQELFGAKTEEASRPARAVSHPWWQAVGASAAAFAVAVFTLLNVAQLTVTGASSGSSPVSFSNYQSAASFAMASAPVNTLRAPIFGWTKPRPSGSTTRSFDLLNTNTVLH
jgi:hypothetical protein